MPLHSFKFECSEIYRVYLVNENCRTKFVLVRSSCPYCQVLVVGITRARFNGRYMIKNVLAK